MRVFEPYLQYVELSLTGAAIQRHRLSIPPSIQKLGGTKEIEARLHTTFELIEKEDAKLWLNTELNRVFPSAESLIQEMRLEQNYKDMTFETLNRDDFLVSIKAAYPNLNWDKTYDDFKAAGEDESKQKKA